jgi:hypothetical protein
MDRIEYHYDGENRKMFKITGQVATLHSKVIRPKTDGGSLDIFAVTTELNIIVDNKLTKVETPIRDEFTINK